MKKIFYRLFYFYFDGFRNMTWGRKLWLIVIIKLFVMFVVLRLFFFKDFLNTNFENHKEKRDYIIKELTE